MNPTSVAVTFVGRLLAVAACKLLALDEGIVIL